MTEQDQGLYSNLIPEDVKANAARTRAGTNWNAPFSMGDDLRITTPVAAATLSRRTRSHLADMDPARRAQLEREWLEAEASIPSVHDPISETIKRRAEDEWRAIEETQRGE